MYRRRRHRDPESDRKQELLDVAARRRCHWLSTVLASVSALIGILAVFVIVSGIRAGESATQVFGSLIIGGWLALLSLVPLAIALLFSRPRIRTLAFGLPSVACLLLLRFQPAWVVQLVTQGT